MAFRSKSSKPAVDPTEGLGAGQKSPDAEPEPLVGAGASVVAPSKTASELDGDHGRKAEAELAAERADEARDGDGADSAASAEAADQDEVPTAEVRAAEAVAAAKAADLAAVEAEVGREAFELGLTAAGDRKDHLRAVQVASRAAKEALDGGDGNVARARAFAAVEDLDALDSPHGRPAEEQDPWAGARWAPHGDQNVPADSDLLNNSANEQYRGLNPERDNRLSKLFREGIRISDERADENRAAARVRKAEKVDNTPPPATRVRLAQPDPDASER